MSLDLPGWSSGVDAEVLRVRWPDGQYVNGGASGDGPGACAPVLWCPAELNLHLEVEIDLFWIFITAFLPRTSTEYVMIGL